MAQEAFAQACGFSVWNRKLNKVRNTLANHTGAVLEGERSFRCFFHMEAASVSKVLVPFLVQVYGGIFSLVLGDVI